MEFIEDRFGMGIGVFTYLLDEVPSVIVGMGNDVGYFALYFGFEE